jgi:hypothetical protein
MYLQRPSKGKSVPWRHCKQAKEINNGTNLNKDAEFPLIGNPSHGWRGLAYTDVLAATEQGEIGTLATLQNKPNNFS